MNAIELRDLTKSYGKSRGIDKLNLSVEEGEFFGFIGPNGAGKSTAIRTMLGLLRYQSGEGYIFGKDIRKDKIEILSEVGYIPSEVFFYPKMKVKQVIAYTAKLKNKNCVDEAYKLCERLSLDTTKRVNQLSLGNKKKLSIVIALMHKPRLLIMDEPTSGLDPLVQKEFFSILKELHQEGTTIFLSSHNLLEIQRYCERAAIIREGHIIACDYVRTLMHSTTKRITLTGDIDFTIDGMEDLKKEDGQVSFLYRGHMKSLLKMLSEEKISDINIEDPDLEEVFLHYYKEGDEL
ncbi:MAG TPA: ABC transporter [Kandleria vitulina]|uniref:ATP-binding cassette domain-containing protein n=1 Tax=Kandleria vitulina TaxID=1630 RepID=UPI000E7ED9A4|nr:ABC transporter [Kandleria vitulina]HBG67217.1 ABC transporter [Kandleria vitulina]HCY53834.1 ABC transporter [Kandleria vitulina]